MNEIDETDEIDEMDDIIQRIRQVCEQEEGVVAAYLFGSAACGRMRRGSDIDVALLVRPELEDEFPFLSFAASLERVCGCEVDVVLLNRAGEILKHKVRQSGRLVFERDPRARKHFEVLGRKLFEDFLYLHRRSGARRLGSGEEKTHKHG
jgi:hypothetical protein